MLPGQNYSKSKIYNILKQCINIFWYVGLFKKNIECLQQNDIKIYQNDDICPNCGDTVDVCEVPLDIKIRIRDTIIGNKTNIQTKRLINFMKKMNIDHIPASDEFYVFDGGNIGYNQTNQFHLNVKNIEIALNYYKWKTKKKYLVLNKKHEVAINENGGLFSDNLSIILVDKIDDDLVMLYLWLSFSSARIISNDKFNIYITKFQDNKYLNNCWNEMVKRQKICFELNNKRFKEIKMVDTKYTYRDNYKSNFVNWRKKKDKYIHIPIIDDPDTYIDSATLSNSLNYNLNSYCCYKINK
jgi:hypothetical protein